jgi:hypothetical protein
MNSTVLSTVPPFRTATPGLKALVFAILQSAGTGLNFIGVLFLNAHHGLLGWQKAINCPQVVSR